MEVTATAATNSSCVGVCFQDADLGCRPLLWAAFLHLTVFIARFLRVLLQLHAAGLSCW